MLLALAGAVLVAGKLGGSGNGAPAGLKASTLPGTDPGDGDTARGGTGQPVDSIPCEGAEQLAFHVHAHLYLLVDGVSQPVSAKIGVVGNNALGPRCLYWLHTHDRSGLVHMEAPRPATFTLGTFFDIWGQPLTPITIARLTVPAGQPAMVYVDGKPYVGDPRNIELKRHTQVVIEVGKLVDPPGYDFGRS